MDFYLDLVNDYYFQILGTSVPFFANDILTYLDFAWINDKRNNLQ